MKVTPLDKLMYTSARLAGEFVVFKQFAELIGTTAPAALEFKDWNYDWASPSLPKIPNNLWSQGHALCVFTDKGVLPGIYNCSLSSGTIPCIQELFITDMPCYLEAVLLYRRTELSFDAIPLMRSAASADGMFPEFQLRFDWQEDTQSWLCQVSPTGFVNAFVYWPTLSRTDDANKTVVEDNLEVLSNILLRYLGAYEAQLEQPGKWDIYKPKAARVTHDSHGNVKKIYRLGQVGYRRYIPTKQGA
jgi:hypothetical protein